MSTFAISFLGTFLGGIVISSVVSLIERLLPYPAPSNEAAKVYPHPIRLRAACLTLFAVWLSLGVLVLLTVAGALGFVRGEGTIVAAMGAFLGLALAYFVLAISLRCTNCRMHLIVQWRQEPRFVEPIFKMDGWASVVMRAAIKRRFRCMYCGQRYRVGR